MKKSFLILPLLFAAPAFAEPLNYNVVSFTESAAATVDNDTMSVTFAVEESGKERQAVSREVTRRFNALSARVAADKTFKAAAGNRSARPAYDDKGRITGWHDTAYLNVESKDFQALSRLIAISRNDAAVRNTAFSVSPQKRHETVNRLSKQALQNFRSRAEFISNTLGFKGYKIVSIQINSDFRSTENTPVMMKAARSAAYHADAEAQTNTENPGSEEIVQTVSGSIQM